RSAPTLFVFRSSWRLFGNPSKSDQFYAFGTLWADAEVTISRFLFRRLRFASVHPFSTHFCASVSYQGTVIEANSHRVFTDILADKLNIGKVYILTRFTLDMPRKAFRTCSFPRLLVISPSSLGGVVRSPPPTFPNTTFELVPFEDIDGRQSPCPYLSGCFTNIILWITAIFIFLYCLHLHLLPRCYGSSEADQNSKPCHHPIQRCYYPSARDSVGQ
ncbi:hypothetical protein LINPERPRIM_LOCUS15373, partial [Linum perenne]